MLEAKTFAYQVRLETTAERNELLTAFAALHGKVERSLFAKTMAGGRGNKDDKNAAKRSSLQELAADIAFNLSSVGGIPTGEQGRL